MRNCFDFLHVLVRSPVIGYSGFIDNFYVMYAYIGTYCMRICTMPAMICVTIAVVAGSI